MTPWRIGRGWSPAEIEAHLASLADRDLSFAALPGGLPIEQDAAPPVAPILAPAPGWTVERFELTLGHEPPGPPAPNGLFSRCQTAVRAYRFADPRITAPHFDPRTPLLGRNILMDTHGLVLRFLVGLRIGAVLDRVDVVDGAERTRFGMRMDTLEGHLLHGSEWVQVAKDHRSGAIRLRIEIRWRPAPLPAWWMTPGLAVFAEPLRARWRRQVARRLRALG